MKLISKTKIICLSAMLFMAAPSYTIAEPISEATEQKAVDLKEIVSFTLDTINKNYLKYKEEQKAKQEEIIRLQKREEFLQQVSSVSKAMSMDLRIPSGISVEEADNILKGTKLEGLGKDFVNAEKEYNVNAIYLMAHAAWESGWGTSKISQTKNNLFGFQAYDDSPGKSARHFKTKGECIMVVAQYINQHYLNEEGDHYNGPNLKGMNIKYASDEKWAEGISKVMIGLVNESNLGDP